MFNRKDKEKSSAPPIPDYLPPQLVSHHHKHHHKHHKQHAKTMKQMKTQLDNNNRKQSRIG